VAELSLTITPLPVRQFADRDFSWLVHRTMLLEQIDVVQIEYTMLGQYAGNYRHIPCLLFEHDVFSQTLRRGLGRGSISTKALIEYLRMRVYEPRLLARVTRVQVCSLANADYLKRLAPKIRNIDADMRAAIDTSHYSAGARQRDLTTLLFVGGFNHFPNIQGLRWFITEVFDRILAERPDVTLEIVGAHPPPGPNIWDEHPNVRFIGAVSDVREPLRRASVFICPILTGSGIRVKLLEAFASEIPVVSTTIGAEGLASDSGVICELADTPDAFAKSVILLLENSTYRAELVARARLMVNQERNSREATARLERVYQHEVLQVRPGSTLRTAHA
jgi:glycosyltransferase involved in cell wall biosynthesis